MKFTDIMNQIGILFFVLFLGFVLTKMKILNSEASKTIASLIVKVTAPLLIITSMSEKSTLTGKEILNIIIIAIAVYAFLFLMTLIVPVILRVKKEEVGIYKFMIMFSNVAFMGFPVAYAIFAEEGIIYAAIFNLPFYFLVFTLGIYFVRPHDQKVSFKLSQFINPGVIGVLIGLFLFWTGLSLPSFLKDSFKLVGGLTTPLSMLVIGVSLSTVDFRSLLTNFRIYLYCVFKLLLVPFSVMFILKALGFEGLMVGIPTIITGMPVAANAVILAKEYGGNDRLASEAIFVSTIFCIITIPLLVSFL